MYERLLLESGKVFVGRSVSSIGANVVDDSQAITIPVHLEGLAVIVEVVTPSEFVPDVSLQISVTVRNDGEDDHLSVKLTNTDTGTVLIDYTNPSVTPSGLTWVYTMTITLTQETDFHGLVEVGHVE